MSPCNLLMEPEVEHLSQTSNAAGIDAAQPLPVPGTEAYEALPQFPKRSPLPFRRTIRRHELRQIVPLAETTIYEMERRGEFPRRFNLLGEKTPPLAFPYARVKTLADTDVTQA